MSEFVWGMAISFQLLFIVISTVIFIYTRENSFRYYALYNIFLVIYILSRNDEFYDGAQNYLSNFIGKTNAENLMTILSFFIQVAFYNFYTAFALYFLDLDKFTKKYFKININLLKIFGFIFLIFRVFCYVSKNPDLYVKLYIFVYVPIMLLFFIPSIYRGWRYSGDYKYFFLFGVCIFICCALIAFIGSFNPSLKIDNPIFFFYVGIVIETLFFSLGLAYKVKLINDEKNRVNYEVTKHKHQQQLTKIQGLLEGEEKERKRIALELHDGIAGDLAAIKFQLASIKLESEPQETTDILQEVTEIMNKSCLQIREISHNLSPSGILNFGLLNAVSNFCAKEEKFYGIKINFSTIGEEISLEKSVEIHIYRIIQELVNNVVKHSNANIAEVKIEFDAPNIFIYVKDNGKGFSQDHNSNGIGLININSRIRFLNARFKKENTETGSSFVIKVNTDYLPKN